MRVTQVKSVGLHDARPQFLVEVAKVSPGSPAFAGDDKEGGN
jgi:hypothetical protein